MTSPEERSQGRARKAGLRNTPYNQPSAPPSQPPVDPGAITLGGRTFAGSEIGEMSDFEREYLYGLEQQALGNVESLAQQQMRRNIGQLAGAQEGIARSMGARSGAAALRSGMSRGEQVLAQGQEQLGALKSQEQQIASDTMRDQILQRIANQRGFNAQQAAAEESRKMGLIGTGIQALATIGSALIFSDERLKSDKSPEKGEGDIRELLSSLQPTNYDMGGKNETGVLLNEKVENTEAGKEMIRKGPAGLRMIDQPQATKKMLAAMALLHKDNEELRGRLGKLEGKKGKK
tara:strand:+ start:28259 stop:29131 length:873 start_codon:yes stop_codon:yes gene_type:complete